MSSNNKGKKGRQTSPVGSNRKASNIPPRAAADDDNELLLTTPESRRLAKFRSIQAAANRTGPGNQQPQFLNDEHQVQHLRQLHNKTMSHENAEMDENEDIGAAQPIEHVIQTDMEKSGFLATLNDMRKKNSTTPGFACDVSFAVRGRIFAAHKFVVGGCSRWLRSLLAEGDEEVVNLDMIRDEASFELVLNYMYGEAIALEVPTIEGVIQVSRRLELVSLEQKCWSFLLLSVNEDNCAQLHELADRYGCTPLKLASWRVIQQNVPGYALSPAQLLSSMQSNNDPTLPMKSHREKDGSVASSSRAPSSVSRPPRYDAADGVFEDDDEDAYPSIFSSFMSPDKDNTGKEGVDSAFFHNFFSENFFEGYTAPEKLEEGALASQVLKGWATKLQLTWMECHPEIRGVSDPYKFYYEGEASGEQADELKKFLGGLSEAELEAVRRRCDEKLNPSGAKAKAGSSSVRMPTIAVDYRERLIEFYSQYRPENLDKIDDIMQKWAGTEDDMLVKLYVKYEKPMPSELKIDICCHQYLMQLQARQQDQLSTIMAANNSSGIDYNVQGDRRKKRVVRMDKGLKRKQDEDDNEDDGQEEDDGKNAGDDIMGTLPAVKDGEDEEGEGEDDDFLPPPSSPPPPLNQAARGGNSAGKAVQSGPMDARSDAAKSRTRTSPRVRLA